MFLTLLLLSVNYMFYHFKKSKIKMLHIKVGIENESSHRPIASNSVLYRFKQKQFLRVCDIP